MNPSQMNKLIKQLYKEQQKRLLGIIDDENEVSGQTFSKKEKAFLKELDVAVSFVNNYPSDKPSSASFKQMLDAL
jgi:hypothetical protein